MNKKVNEKDLFNCIDGELPGELPILTEQEKNRLYKMSERKFNNSSVDTSSADSDSVSGVERYSRPVWKRRLASVAAAGVLLAGSGGLAYYIKNGSLDGFNDNSAVEMVSPSSETNYDEIAAYLLDGYTDFRSRMEAPESDPSTKVTLHIEGEDVVIARYADRDINSVADLRALGAKYMTGEYLDNNYDFREALDKSAYREGQDISGADWWAGNAEAMFFMYDGELCTYYHEDLPSICYKDAEVSDIKDDSFTVRATFEIVINKLLTEAPYIISVVRTEDGEWRISQALPDKDKEAKQTYEESDIIYACKRYSDRYVQLQEYIYTRSAETDNYLNITMRIGDKEVGRKYLRIEDDSSNPDNVFWNVHTIDEIKQLSGMDNAFFEKMYGDRKFCKLDDSYSEGEVVTVEFEDPDFIEYNGHMYSQCTQEARKMLNEYNGINILVPFTDEPEIIRVSDNEIVFRRKTGYTSKYAEIDSMLTTFEFTLRKGMDNDVWKLSGVSAETDVSDNTDRTGEELGDLVEEYAELVCALSSYDYVNNDETVTYYLENKNTLIMFAPYHHPIYDTPEKVETAVKSLFTDNFRSKYLDYNLLDDEIDTAWEVKDFSNYPDGYVFSEAEMSDNDGKNIPFSYRFILLNGKVYRGRHFGFALPYFQYEVHSIVSDPVIDGDTANISAEYSYTTDIGQVKTTKVTFSCIKEESGWKIDDILNWNN